MNKAAGLAIGGAILSITIGALVGLVIHAGQVERASNSAAVTSSVAASTSTDSEPGTPMSSAPASVLPSAPIEPAQPGAHTVSSGIPAEGTRDAVTSVISHTSGTSASNTVGTTAGTPLVTTSATEPAGVDSAGAPCPTLANKSSDAVGTTVYCQVDQTDRTLRWRAVVNNGGCLNQKMVGIGADGITYRCAKDAGGRNHWESAD
ncbi:MAG: hypothetical protein ABI382_09020 [Nakamurella sp.]